MQYNNHGQKKILIVGPTWLGDMIMAQALFKVLKATPNCTIDVIAPEWSLPIVQCMPEVSNTIVQPVGHGRLGLLPRYNMAKQLRQQQYDQAIVLTNSWKSALLPFWAKIPQRTGWLGELRWGLLNDVRYLDAKKLPTLMQRYVALAYRKNAAMPAQHPYPALTVEQAHAESTAQKFQVATKNKKILAICPGAAFGTSKRWPEHYFAKVAQSKIEQGWQIWLFGSGQDEPVLARISASLPPNSWHSFAGDVALAEKLALMSIVDVVLTNDSGLMHMASSLGKYILAIYGPTSPAYTPPFGKLANIISKQLSCSPCFKRTCPLKHHNCMQAILPEQILAKLTKDGW